MRRRIPHLLATLLVSMALLLAGVALSILVLRKSCLPDEVGVISLPSPAHISRMKATLYDSPLDALRLPEFTIPQERMSIILSPFQSPQRCRFPSGLVEVGRVSFSYNTGDDLIIKLYWHGKSRLYFTISDIPCARGGVYSPIQGEEIYADEITLLREIINEIYKESLTGQESTTLAELDDLLQRSMGRSLGPGKK